MRLKEAFQLQNKISSLYDNLNILLVDKDTFAYKQIKHFYSKANINNDLTEDMPVSVHLFAGNDRYDFDKLVDLIQAVGDDKQKLNLAIDKAKASCPTNIDALKSDNMIKQRLVRSLLDVNNLKDNIYDSYADFYGKDNEGKPATYHYPTKISTQYKIDKNHLKAIVKRLNTECNDNSLKLDELLVTMNVDFNPTFDYDSDIEDIYLSYDKQ